MRHLPFHRATGYTCATQQGGVRVKVEYLGPGVWDTRLLTLGATSYAATHAIYNSLGAAWILREQSG